jgi:hypothetical protein
MNKLLIISNCKQCYNSYYNYLHDGKHGYMWCSQLDIKLNTHEYSRSIPKECPLMDTDTLEPDERDYNPSDSDPIDDNA